MNAQRRGDADPGPEEASHERALGYGPRDTTDYWMAKACGTTHAAGQRNTQAFFEEADRFRYDNEPIADFARFPAWAGKRVLEIGTGMGGDISRFIRSGARAVGIDRSPAALESTGRRLALAQQGSPIVRADALQLPLRSGTFDLVWSWGVLHHTGDITRAVSEARRVLRPGGQLRVMLYHRPSWVAIAAWVRWSLLGGKPFRGLKRTVADHVESPGTMALTVDELRDLLVDFADVQIRVVGTYWDRAFVPVLGTLAGSRLGWFALITATKPQAT